MLLSAQSSTPPPWLGEWGWRLLGSMQEIAGILHYSQLECLLSDLYAFLDPPCENIAFFLSFFSFSQSIIRVFWHTWCVMDYSGAFAHAKHVQQSTLSLAKSIYVMILIGRNFACGSCEILFSLLSIFCGHYILTPKCLPILFPKVHSSLQFCTPHLLFLLYISFHQFIQKS